MPCILFECSGKIESFLYFFIVPSVSYIFGYYIQIGNTSNQIMGNTYRIICYIIHIYSYKYM